MYHRCRKAMPRNKKKKEQEDGGLSRFLCKQDVSEEGNPHIPDKEEISVNDGEFKKN